MGICEQIKNYLSSPDPVWNKELSAQLYAIKVKNLEIQGLLGLQKVYSTAGAYLKDTFAEIHSVGITSSAIRIEEPDFIRLSNFYLENDLKPLRLHDLHGLNAISKINRAMGLLYKVPQCGETVNILVKYIQVLSQAEPEFDVSYSHPEIPFTIFVSVGEEDSDVAVIRIAESILHEAMHLKLTLIEELVPLIEDSSASFYSPWREEERPSRGVLHGVYVFKAIKSWYQGMAKKNLSNYSVSDFINWRIESIVSELNSIIDFKDQKALSIAGMMLSQKLLL